MFKEEIVNLLSKQTNLKKEEISNLLEVPPDEKLGDYAFPCFVLSRKLKKNPQEIAKELEEKLSKNQIKGIEKIQATGAYVNFFINNNLLAENILRINGDFGKQKAKKEKRKIIFLIGLCHLSYS